jgi:hypothetical protein
MLPFFMIENKKGSNQQPTSKNLNLLTINDYYNRLRSIALSVFKWDGLPESCSERFLEISLYSMGKALFVNDEQYGFLTLRAIPDTTLNFYGESTGYTAEGETLYNKHFNNTECVLIRNNYSELPTDLTLQLFAYRMAEAERTIDVNIKAQKTPKVLTTDEKGKLTMKNIWEQYDGNEPLILTSKEFDMSALKSIDLTAPYVADKLQMRKQNVWCEALTFLGVNNSNITKKERSITDEVNANNEEIDIMAQTMLLTRQQACEQINKMFNLNVSVKKRSLDEKMEVGDGE